MSEVNAEPSGYGWRPDVDAKTLSILLDDNNGRLVALDVFFSGGKQRLAAVWVSNTGDQELAWSWNHDVDAATLKQVLAANKARLVALAPFVVSGKLRLAAVWVNDAVADSQAWSWSPDVNPATLGQTLTANNQRLTTLCTYELAGKRKYAAVWVGDTGDQKQAWSWRHDVDGATLGQLLAKDAGRLVSLAPFLSGDHLRYAAVWVSNTGPGRKTWWWYPGLDEPALGRKLDQFCTYPVELRTYAVGARRLLSCVLYAYRPGPDPNGAKLIEVTGTGSLDELKNNVPVLDEELSLTLNLKNKTAEAVKITEAQPLLTQTGGWVEYFFTQPLYGAGGIFKGQSQDVSPGQAYSGSKSLKIKASARSISSSGSGRRARAGSSNTRTPSSPRRAPATPRRPPSARRPPSSSARGRRRPRSSRSGSATRRRAGSRSAGSSSTARGRRCVWSAGIWSSRPTAKSSSIRSCR
ncbi:MAG TPA: hypothetical protein VF546_09955 [Pyrinomonadaceae bacterium]|jgi:hypothetical protein